MVYGYDFFVRYLKVFDEVKLVAHVKSCEKEEVKNMVRVDGKNLIIHEVPFPHGKIEYIKKYNQIRKHIKESFYDCDAAILRIPDQLAFQLYSYLKKNNIPVGIEVTSDSWDFFSPGAIKSIFRPFLRMIWHLQQKYICKNAIGTAYVTKNAIQKRYPPKRAQKGDGFSTNYTDTNLDKAFFYAPRDYSPPNEKFRIIHVSGNISGYAKGHKELIEAIGSLTENNVSLELVLVGAGKLSQDIQGIIHRHKLEKNIKYKGLISDSSKLRNELIKADIFVFPSYREGLPRVIVEAMACGLPCIATNLPGITELIEEDCLVPVKDSEAIIKKIDELISNPILLTKISKRNFDEAQKYSIEKMEKKRDQFYQRLKNIAEIGR
jgi:glycosyltransferase involved in cell wall biosynthesis